MNPTEPNYGAHTVCRPTMANVPDAPANWEPAVCPYCGAPCWITAVEPRPLPAGYTAACTNCAFKRGLRQREMDRARHEREQKESRSE